MTREQTIQENGRKLLHEIRGARLTSVQFVLNYLILGFDEKGALTTLVWPEIIDRGMTMRFGMPGYRDSLCALITKTVEDLEITNDETMRIAFDSKMRIEIPLRAYEHAGDRAIFTAPKNRLFVW